LKAKVTKKLIINVETTLDSSEAIMLQQGGQFKTQIPFADFLSIDLMDAIANEIQEAELVLTVQIERGQMSRHSWITEQAEKAKKNREKYYASEREHLIEKFFERNPDATREEAEREIPIVL